LIFGLSNAQAAATLAAVLVGYNIILNQTEVDQAALLGQIVEPIRLLNESVLNGTILMILVTCTIATFVAQKGAQNIALADITENDNEPEDVQERILVPINKLETAEELIQLSLTVKSKKNNTHLYALTVIDNKNAEIKEKEARKILNKAAVTASAADIVLKELIRYDINNVNGISSVVREHNITDLILGLHEKKGISDNFLGNLTKGILTKCNTTTLIYKASQPLSTIKRHMIFVPERAEREVGFPFWLLKIWNIARNTGAKLVFYASAQTIEYIRDINLKHPIQCEFIEFTNWDDFLIISRDVRADDNMVFVLSRKDRPSFAAYMNRIPDYLNKYFISINFMLIYPIQTGVDSDTNVDFKNPSALESLERLDDLGKTIANLFKRK